MKFSFTIAIIVLFVCVSAPAVYAQFTTDLLCQFDKNSMIRLKLSKAQECINKGDYDGAKSYLNGVLNLDRNNVKAKQMLVTCNNGGKSLQTISTTLNLSKSYLSFYSLGGVDNITISTNSSTYNVELLPTWCTVQKYNGYFVISCNSNPSTTARNDYFTVKAGNKSERVNVYQEAKTTSSNTASSSFNLSKSSLSFTALGGNENISITTNSSSYSISLLPDWCTVQKYANYFTITCNSNTLSATRNDYFTVTAGEKSVRVNVSQAAGVESTNTPITLSVSKDYIYFNTKGGNSESIKVTSNAANYSITFLPSWCTIKTHDGYFVLSCKENYNSEKRSDWLYVNAGDKQVKVFVNQNGTSAANTYIKEKKLKHTNLYLGIGILKPMIFKADGKTLSNMDFGYSFTIGIVKTLGLYAKINTNFSSVFGDYSPSTLPDNYYGTTNTYSNSSFNRYGVVGGLMLNLNPIMLYVGAGKGHYYHIEKTDLYKYLDDSFVKKINLKTMSYNGLETDAGLIINFNKVGFSLGVSSFSFKYYEVNAGLGIRF